MPRKLINEIRNVTRVRLRKVAGGNLLRDLQYVGRGGVFLELQFDRRWTGERLRFRWYYRLNGGELWHGPFKGQGGKVAAMIDAAYRCGRDPLEINWFPIRGKNLSLKIEEK